jgi:hypothetical protein
MVAPLTVAGVLAALTLSASTHAVIDRRWLVRWLITVKGCDGWKEAPYVIDQSLHIGVLLVASVVGAAVNTSGGTAGIVVLSAAIVVAALIFEHRQAINAGRPDDAAWQGGPTWQADAGRPDDHMRPGSRAWPGDPGRPDRHVQLDHHARPDHHQDPDAAGREPGERGRGAFQRATP